MNEDRSVRTVTGDLRVRVRVGAREAREVILGKLGGILPVAVWYDLAASVVGKLACHLCWSSEPCVVTCDIARGRWWFLQCLQQ